MLGRLGGRLPSLSGSPMRGSYSDVALAFGVVAIVALMILPLPPLLIDALVAFNILIGTGLLLIALYIPRPTAFSSFPSVLLLATLFRLSLSIAITRMILLEADGGHIIDAFGTLVVGGNLVVGLVVFLIITVVQFIVIAKGAERVAEVAARFTLDAMPGKQLSIDSDLRSGLIDKDEARRRRRMLEVESQLHGSLDGAMKFVKGDAVAGIVIIIINLLGGLAVGVLQRGLPLSEALHVYSILTIGDGLVAQIPALLCAISAGLVVTRTGSEERDDPLGAVIARQLAEQPRVAVIAGLLCLLLMFMPGFPWPVFLVLGLTLLAVSAWRRRHDVASLRRLFGIPDPPPPEEPKPDATAAVGEIVLPAPLLLEMETALLQALGREAVQAAALRAAQALRESSGVPLPAPQLRPRDDLPANRYALSAFGLRVAGGELQPQQRFVEPGSADDADEPRGEFWPALRGQWRAPMLAPPDAPEAAEVLRRHLSLALRRHLGLFLGIQETSNLINRWSRDYPDLVKELLRVVPPQRVSEVLRRLADEGVPLRDLRDVFEAIADIGAREKDVIALTEQVRGALRRQISDQLAGPERRLDALLAHPELEDGLRQSARGGLPGGQLAVDPELFARLTRELREARGRLAAQWDRTVLLCSTDVRRHLRRLTENEFFELPVLAFQELAGDVNVTPVGQLHG